MSKTELNVGFISASPASPAIFAFLKEMYGMCDIGYARSEEESDWLILALFFSEE